MTDKEFCELDSKFYGEEIDHIKQISLRTFNGEELKEYVEHCIKLSNLNKKLPKFLYEDKGQILIGYHGDTVVTYEWNEFLTK